MAQIAEAVAPTGQLKKTTLHPSLWLEVPVVVFTCAFYYCKATSGVAPHPSTPHPPWREAASQIIYFRLLYDL